MRLVLVWVSLLGLSLGASLDHKLKPCRSPSVKSGAITLLTQNEAAFFNVIFAYDEKLQRIRMFEAGTYHNQSFTNNVLLLYTEGVMYEINSTASTCVKKPLKTDVQPLRVPFGANLLGKYVVGSNSRPEEGLALSTWIGHAPDVGVNYLMTVTNVGCVPISNMYQTREHSWVTLSFMNIDTDAVASNALDPPSFCPGPDVQPEGPPLDFVTIFLNMRRVARENSLNSYTSLSQLPFTA